jgi:ABC-type nitrate/sulfonate/bicarbonate transport system substrate-binding protein
MLISYLISQWALLLDRLLFADWRRGMNNALRVFYRLCLLLLLAPQVQAQTIKVRAVYPSIDVQYLPAYLGQTKGFFKEESLETELIVMRGARSGVQALVSGDVQFGLALGAVFSAIWSGADLKILAQMTNMLPFSLIVRPEIQRIEDLKGKRIGASVGSTTQALVYDLLKLHGIDPDKGVEYVNIPGAGPRIAALEKGLIAATPLASPGDLKALQAGFKRLVFFGDVLPPMSFTGLVASGRYIRENPKTVERMVRAIVRGTVSARDDSAGAIGAMQTYMKMTLEDSRETYRLVGKSFSPMLSEPGVKKMADLVSTSIGVGQTKDPKDYMDVSFLNRALSDLKRK